MNSLLLRGFKPDPSICMVDNEYYLVTSSFEFFPGLPIFQSIDLIHWEQIGNCINRNSQISLDKVENSQGLFAPTIRYNQGVFYIVCTNVGGGENFVISSTNPRKSWSDPVYLNDWGGIDPSLFFEDNRAYIHGTKDWNTDEPSGIYLAEIDLDTGKLLSERTLIWTGTGATDPEGPHIYKIDGWYYLLISEGGTEFGYMLTVARSSNLFGPYDSYSQNPILTNRSMRNPVQAVGHGDIINKNNEWFIVFLGFRCIRYPRQHNLGRETFLTSFDWTEDGWPRMRNVNQFLLFNDEEEMLSETIPISFEDNFNAPELKKEWLYIRNPILENYTIQDSVIYLKASKARLNDSYGISFIGIPQSEYNFYCETKVITDKDDILEVGLIVYVRDDFHYDLFIKSNREKSTVCMRKRVGDLNLEEFIVDLDTVKVLLFIEGTPDKYYFGYKDSYGVKTIIFEGQTRLLSTEVTGGFTGTLLGIYACTEDQLKNQYGKFNHFIYKTN